MRTRTMVLAGLVLLLAGTTFAQQMPSTPVSKEFPHVLASVDLQPGQSASITVPDAYFKGAAPGEMTVYIPVNSFTDPVRFQLLASSNARWDGMVKSGEKVVANFAYRVLDLKTDQLVAKFASPVQYTVSDSMIDKNSIYWAVKPGSPPMLINANKASTIHGSVLSHATPVSTVGWIITTPSADLANMSGGSSSMGSSSSSSNGM